MKDEGILLFQQGRPLTEKEMCDAYRRSCAVWNGYRRSTQSGVLPNSYMQGTPVMATHLPSFDEFVIPGVNGAFIDSMRYEDIIKAIDEIAVYGEKIYIGCREYFMKHFYYGAQIDSFKEIIASTRT